MEGKLAILVANLPPPIQNSVYASDLNINTSTFWTFFLSVWLCEVALQCFCDCVNLISTYVLIIIKKIIITLDPINNCVRDFLLNLCHKISLQSGDDRKASVLFQRVISVSQFWAESVTERRQTNKRSGGLSSVWNWSVAGGLQASCCYSIIFAANMTLRVKSLLFQG